MKKIMGIVLTLVLIFLVTSNLYAQDSVMEIRMIYSQGDILSIEGTEFGTKGTVKLCNGSTYAKIGICKNQTIISWTDTKIEISILFPSKRNIRKEGELRYSYLYVVPYKKTGTTPGYKVYLNSDMTPPPAIPEPTTVTQ